MDDINDPDRAAILARRRRFIALAISSLAVTGCKRPKPEPDSPESKSEEPGETNDSNGETGYEDEDLQMMPQSCLRFAKIER